MIKLVRKNKIRITTKEKNNMKSKTLRVDDEIELHGCHLAYAKDIFSIIENDRAYLREWLTWVDVTNEEKDTYNFLKGSHQMNKGGQQLNTWIFYKGEVCGSIGFVKIDKANSSGEIGYWLRKSEMGRGIMTRSCKRMVRYGFEKLGMQRIVIRAAEGNKPSLAIPKRLGFVLEGKGRKEIKIREKYHDTHIFSMLKEEFEEKGFF